MELNDPSTAECLRSLLNEQARRLRMSAQRIELLRTSSVHATQPVRWSGPARIAHDMMAQRVISHLTAASHSSSLAADESARAVATLSSRVG